MLIYFKRIFLALLGQDLTRPPAPGDPARERLLADYLKQILAYTRDDRVDHKELHAMRDRGYELLVDLGLDE